MRDPLQNNPEVMGRSEPESISVQAGSESWPDMGEIHVRFEQLQSEFIDDPGRAVEKAERMMDDLFNKMHERIQAIHHDVEQNGDTEHLRLAMRSYREMLQSLGASRAA